MATLTDVGSESPTDPEVDVSAAVFEMVTARGWGDGLPVIAPTERRVAEMLAAGPYDASDVVAVLPPAEAGATAEIVAANAVMAGCRPEHFPLLLAAVRAVANKKFALQAINTTTNPVVPMLIVNGPQRNELDLNSSWSVLGPTHHANGVIGRALSLCMIHIAGRIPGVVSKATYRSPGGHTLCAAENEEESPWEPLHVSRGFQAEADVVSMLAVCGVTNIVDIWSVTADDLAATLAGKLSTQHGTNFAVLGLGEIGVMLSPGHARLLAERFPDRSDFQEYLHDRCRIPRGFITDSQREILRRRDSYTEDDRGVMLSSRPDQWLVFVAGGPGGYQSAYIPTFGDAYVVSEPVSEPER